MINPHPAISVIIPVYNAEKHIGFCIDSVLSQTFSNIEVIVLDDCSTDSTIKILEHIRENDARLRIIRLEANGGQGRARNIGIENAVGDYLSFVDADDTIAPDFLELLYNKAVETGAEIVKGLCAKVYKDSSTGDRKIYNIRSLNAIIRWFSKSDIRNSFCFSYQHWSAIYKRSFIIENNLRYGESRVSQDTTFLMRIAAHLRSIETVDEAVYYYWYRSSSTIHTFDSARFSALLDSLEEQVDFINTGIAAKSVFFTHTGLMITNSLAAQSYLSTRVCAEESNAFLSRIYMLAKKYSYIDETSAADYSIKAFMESRGRENISIAGRIVGLDDNTEWQLNSLDRLVEHINVDDASRANGFAYLNQGVKTLFRNAYIDSFSVTPEMYESLSEGVRKRLLRLEHRELIEAQHPILYCLIEYGADLFLHNCTFEADEQLNTAHNLIERLSRFNAFLEAHGDTCGLRSYAKYLLNEAFGTVTNTSSIDSKKSSVLLFKLMREAERLNK